MSDNSKNDFIRENKIEEYKALRAEMIHYFERRQQNINFAILITLGVLGIGYKLDNLDNFILFFVAALLIDFLWFDEIRRLRAIFRIGTYIQIFIESEVPGLKWETHGGKHKIQTSLIDRALPNAVYPSLIIINAVLGLFFMNKENALISILSLLLSNTLIILSLIILCISIVLSIYLIKESYNVITKGREKEVEFWKNKKEEMQNNPQP